MNRDDPSPPHCGCHLHDMDRQVGGVGAGSVEAGSVGAGSVEAGSVEAGLEPAPTHCHARDAANGYALNRVTRIVFFRFELT